MHNSVASSVSMVVLALVIGTDFAVAEEEPKPPRNQYEFEDIIIPPASADEPILDNFSLKAALDYIDNGALAWSKERKCVSCHTNGSYLFTRPALTGMIGNPPQEMRDFFVQQLDKLQVKDRKVLRKRENATQVAYVAAGLAEWDKHVSNHLSTETDRALRLLFEVQREDGAFNNHNCWPPLESSYFHSATVAAMAITSAPGWLASSAGDSPELLDQFEQLKTFLRDSEPPHDYGRLLLLWASARIPDLIDSERKQSIIEMILDRQKSDGGWSIRTFATPESWGKGNRAEKLRAEPELDNPPSDGHLTGLAVIVLRESGVCKTDPQIRKAIKWILNNQRQSGRWWTRSLNSDDYHFITFSGSCYPLLALANCDAIPLQP